MKTSFLTLALMAGSVVALTTSPASAQGYGNGLFHHTSSGMLGSSQHFTYRDLYNNQVHSHRGYTHAPSALYRSGHVNHMQCSSPMSSAGTLRPGMVLPDGAIVVSVGR